MTGRPTGPTRPADRHPGARAIRRHALRSVRPRVAAGWTGVLLAATLILDSPLTLGAFLAALIIVGRHLGAGPETGRMLRVAVPFALALFVIQSLIDRTGITVVLRLGGAGPFGQLDVTAEAIEGAAGQALRVTGGLVVSALALALVDVDRMLASVRRRAPRFGVTATLALRLAPALAGDGRRYAEGLRSRADAAPGRRLGAGDRRLVVDALVGRSLARASDAAAILELRGLRRSGRRSATSAPGRWSSAERRTVVASAVFVVAIAAVKAAGG